MLLFLEEEFQTKLILHEIDSLVRKFVIGREYEGVFLKPRYGDASGVRGAARLGRSATY